MARKAKRTKCPEILSDESSSDEDEQKNKEESSDDEDKESEEEPPKKTAKREKPKQKATPKSKKSVKSANVKKADSSTTKKNQNSSKKESESEDSSDDEPLIKKLKKPPTDEELKETIKKLLASANLEEVTMKQICKKEKLQEICLWRHRKLRTIDESRYNWRGRSCQKIEGFHINGFLADSRSVRHFNKEMMKLPLVGMKGEPDSGGGSLGKVYENYPAYDLTERKDFIKTTVKEISNDAEYGSEEME
ncbi:hypothetical protein P7K49_007254 [Saguinus oedipus]|uniref:DEK-C domain-containing protein n=1 Tax=Saguinus oedipus TaxID=9490 RepID=A0ABQ9VWP9_SAGOE|nr:hypothetical protein P7K49_007254 [Saguinus oedipus]